MIEGMIVALMVIGTSTFSYDFTEADSLFEIRDEGRDVCQASRASYQEALTQVNGEELIYAVSQIGRLDYYEGEMLLAKSDRRERKRIFGDCWRQTVEYIRPEIVGERPEYYYWKGLCMGFYGEVASTWENLGNIGLFKRVLNKGLELDTRYEGGGMLRVRGGVAANDSAKPVGLYYPQYAYDLGEQALGSEPAPGSHLGGWDFYENYRVQVRALAELERYAEAKDLVTDVVAEIDELTTLGELPQGREAETLKTRELLLAETEGMP